MWYHLAALTPTLCPWCWWVLLALTHPSLPSICLLLWLHREGWARPAVGGTGARLGVRKVCGRTKGEELSSRQQRGEEDKNVSMVQRWVPEGRELSCSHLRWGPLCIGAKEEPGQRKGAEPSGGCPSVHKVTHKRKRREEQPALNPYLAIPSSKSCQSSGLSSLPLLWPHRDPQCQGREEGSNHTPFLVGRGKSLSAD